MTGFEQTSAVVTGSSSGIGRAISLALVAAGVNRIAIHYRANRDGVEETESLLQADGVKVTTLQGDLSVAADRSRIAETAFDQLGPIQTWINNAGADVLTGTAATLDFDAKLRRLVEVDLLGTIDLSRIVSNRLIKQASTLPPSIVFIGWDQAPHGMEGDAGQMFGTVKAAVMAYAASLAQTIAPTVRVNTVAPGWIRTTWGESTSDYWDARAKSQSLMARWGRPDDVANAVVFVANPDNSFVTGQVIDVNGGWNRKVIPCQPG
jgi:3-oxoacyl-[acyl-carrier protein] reductase